MKKILDISTNTWEGIQDLFINTDIQELTFTENNYTINVIRKKIDPIISNIPSHHTINTPTQHPPSPQPIISDNNFDDENKYTKIVSPIMGTFYTASSPNEPNFVTIGSVITADTTVCIVEAMKIFNEVKSPVSGKIVSILHSKGDSVSVDEVLFIVEHQ